MQNNTSPIQDSPMQPTQPMTPPSMSMPQANTTNTPVAHKSSMGPMIGAIIVILVLLAGALYFFGTSIFSTPNTGTQTQGNTADYTPTSTSSSDDLDAQAAAAASSMNSLDADLNTNMDGLNQSMHQ